MIRSLGVVALALLSVVGLALAWTATTVVQLAATALVMGGTDHPLSASGDDRDYIENYLDNAVTLFINPAFGTPTGTGGDPIAGVGDDDDRYAVTYPASFFPVFGSQTFDSSVGAGRGNLNGCVRGTGCTYNEDVADPASPQVPPGPDFVAFAYSQSAVVASLAKKDLIAERPADGTDVSFFLLANPMRPNGGILSRGPEGLTIPIVGVTFYGATPTDSCETGECYETVDVAAQYDGLGGDAPVGITNLLAVANAALGYYYLHGDLQNGNFDEARYQGSYGDTDYYIVPARRLPILMPFESFVPSPILTLLEAPLKAAIEAGYARDVSPGVATKVGLLPFTNPVQAIVNMIKAIPVGVDDAIAEASRDPDNRPLGTAPVTSPFGVGGPELPERPAAEGGSNLSRSALVGDTSAVEADITEAVVPEEDTGETEQIPAGDVLVDEEEESEGTGGTQKLESTTPRATTKPRTPLGTLRGVLDGFRLPKIRGPIRFDSQREAKTPSPTLAGDRQTATSEPDSTQKDAGGEAAA
jgi:hypothetical protein